MNARELVTPVVVNDTTLFIGDTVYLRGKGIPTALFAAFLGQLKTGELQFLIPKSLSVTLGLSGIFSPQDLSSIERDKPAREAVSIESGGAYISWLPVIVKDTAEQGMVIAVLSGVVAVLIHDEIRKFGTHQLEKVDIMDFFAP